LLAIPSRNSFGRLQVCEYCTEISLVTSAPIRFGTATMLVFRKDLAIEIRTREIVTTAGFFAVLITVMASVAFPAAPESAGGALWIPIAFASILALSRTWQREREDSALTGLLVSPIPRAAIFAGKALGVLVFLLTIELLVVPLVALFFHIELLRVVAPLGVLLLLGTTGVAAMGTLFGAMTVRTRARDLVLATVLLPLLSPTLLAGVSGTTRLFAQDSGMSDIVDYALIMTMFDIVAIGGGLALFGSLVDE
jgi:heme exporter protein B